MRPSELPPIQLAEFMDAFRDHATFCRESLKIRDLSSSLVAMEEFPGQKKLTAAIEKQRKAGKPIRIVALKPRRAMFTAGACSHIFHEMVTYSGRKCTVIANSYKPAGLEAFGYLADFYRHYVPMERHGGSIALPAAVKDNQQQLKLENDSSVEVLSAEGGETRGGGRHVVLGDEVAFWRNAGKTLTGLLNMVPKRKGTIVILQSTANGIGGEFYDLVQRARDPNNEGGFQFLFFSWLEHPIYRMALDENAAKFQASLDEEEVVLLNMHGASLEQLRWRRDTIATECSGSVDTFHQEYPTTPEEAFLSTGRPALDHKALARMPIMDGITGELEVWEDGPLKTLRFFQADRGALTIWRQPQAGRYYVISADPSQGKDVSPDKRSNPDYSVSLVADADTGEHVAMLRGRIRPGPFADYFATLGKYYNFAYLVPEANDAGFIDALVRSNYPTELIYNRESEPGDRRSSTPDQLGFLTNGTTRPWLIQAGEEAIRTFSQQIHSHVVVMECLTFVIKPNGKKEGRDNCHDDCVIGVCLLAIGLRRAPRRKYVAPPEHGVRRGYAVPYGQGRKRVDDD